MLYVHSNLYDLTPAYEFKIVMSVNNVNSDYSIYKINLEQTTNLPEVKTEYIKDINEIKKLVAELIDESFTELRNVNISFESLNDKAFYFESNFSFSTVLKKDIDYVVRVNPDIYYKDCPKEAVKAILAHELSHILDYQQGGLMGIINIGFKMLSKKSLEKYEHRTDLQSISRGYGQSLIEYREWIYKNISAKDIKIKKDTYYKPEEITALVKVFNNAKENGKKDQLLKKWLDNPPLGISQINKGFKFLDN